MSRSEYPQKFSRILLAGLLQIGLWPALAAGQERALDILPFDRISIPACG